MKTRRSWAPLLLFLLLPSPAARAAEPEVTKLSISVAGRTCSALLTRPPDAEALLVLAHGAAMNMSAPWMEGISASLSRRGIATLRFNFPYSEAERTRPDAPPVMQATVKAALAEGARRRGALPLLVGGKSLSTLTIVHLASQGGLDPAQGIVILGFPLHQPNRPSAMNAGVLDAVPLPMLFLQGTRDPLADLPLMRGLVEKLGERATLHVVEEADHQYALPPEASRTRAEVMDELASAIAKFAATLAGPRGG